MSVLETVLTLLTFVLQISILAALLNHYYRRLPFLFVWAIVSALQSVAATAAKFDTGTWTPETATYYWIGEGIIHATLFACVLHMLTESLGDSRHSSRILYLIVGGVIFTLLSTWQSYDPKLNKWMTQLIRDLSFGAMLLNLGLWTILLRRPNRLYLLVSASFGIQLAGSAIGHSLRQMARSLVLTGNLVIALTFMVGLYTMLCAVRKSKDDPDRRVGEDKVPATPVVK